MQAFTISEDWSKILKASIMRGVNSSATWVEDERATRATNGGTTMAHLLLILFEASAGTTNAFTSVLSVAPFRWPQVGQGVSSTGLLKVDGWIRKQEAGAPDPANARMCYSGWKRLSPETDTWWSRTTLLKWSTANMKLPGFSFRLRMKSTSGTCQENKFEKYSIWSLTWVLDGRFL